MTRRYLALCCWLLCLFTLAGCVSPFREVDRVGEYTPEIDPQAGNRSGGTITADLWLPVKSKMCIRDRTGIGPKRRELVPSGCPGDGRIITQRIRQQRNNAVRAIL